MRQHALASDLYSRVDTFIVAQAVWTPGEASCVVRGRKPNRGAEGAPALGLPRSLLDAEEALDQIGGSGGIAAIAVGTDLISILLRDGSATDDDLDLVA